MSSVISLTRLKKKKKLIELSLQSVIQDFLYSNYLPA